MAAQDDKDTARQQLRSRRRALDASARPHRSQALVDRISADPRWATAQTVAAFVPTADEPDITPLLHAALHSGKRLWLPRVIDGPGGVSELVAVTDLTTLVAGPYGLRQPPPDAHAEPAAVPSMELDVVLVPGLAFDRTGTRLGHGPGHYDRLLAPIRALDRPWRIGVCLSEFVDALDDAPLPEQDHDVPMHLLATDDAIVVCGPKVEIPHVIEPATSGRAKCRACATKIEKGTLRFGERVDNPYGDGLASFWFHLRCAALRRPEPFSALMDVSPQLAFDARDALTRHAALGVAHARLPRLTQAMRAPSGRARCRSCHQTIDKATWRVALSMWQDGRFEALGFIHASCAVSYAECSDVTEICTRIEAGSADLTDADRGEVFAAIEGAPPPATAVETDS